MTFKNSFLVLFLLIAFSSCIKTPVASFQISDTKIYTYDTVQFTNTSTNSYYQLWKFGDGYESDAENPSHFYNQSGLFTVELTVYNKSNSKNDIIYNSVLVEQPTDLVIRVYLADTEKLVEDCNVKIYTDQFDYVYNVNEKEKGYTNDDGVIWFRNIEEKAYFVNAVKIIGLDTLSNKGLGFMTNVLQRDYLNVYNFYIQ